MENEPLKDMITEEIAQWSTWEAIKFIGVATIIAPNLVMEAGKDYIINKVKRK